MKLAIIKRLGLCLIGLSTLLYGNTCAAFPLPTADLKRIAQTAKTIKLQLEQVKEEIESNLKIVQQIQNGGYAEAAGTLFGKIESGDYDRYGSMISDLGANLETGALSTQAAMSKKAKREAINKKMAEKEVARKEAAAEKARQKAAELNSKNASESKEKTYNKAYNWIKSYGRRSVNAATALINSAGSGGSLADTGKNIYDSGAVQSGIDIYNDTVEEYGEDESSDSGSDSGENTGNNSDTLESKLESDS